MKLTKFKNFFSRRTPPSTETRPSSQSASETSSSNTQAAGGIPAASNDSSETNQMVPQSINRTPNDRALSSAERPRRADPALDNAVKCLSTLQVVTGMVLPLGLPEVAKSASQLLSVLVTKRGNDEEIRNLIDLTLDISEIILCLVESLKNSSTATKEQASLVGDVLRYLETLQTFFKEYRDQNYASRWVFSSGWKDKIDGIRRAIQTKLDLLNLVNSVAILNTLNSTQQRTTTSRETIQDQAFHEANISGNVRINSYSQFGLDQSRPIPRMEGSSTAFKGSTITGDVQINSHQQVFASS